MEKIYILQDQSGYAVGAAFELDKATEMCKANNWTYRLASFYKNHDTEIRMIAGPIPLHFLK